MIRTKHLREKLSRQEPCLGFWISVADPLVVEALAADCAADWVQVDLEHSGNGFSQLRSVLPAWSARDVPMIVRVPSHDRSMIGRVLELGADGILAPMVNTAQQAQDVCSAYRYPPKGKRGFGPRRASRH